MQVAVMILFSPGYSGKTEKNKKRTFGNKLSGTVNTLICVHSFTVTKPNDFIQFRGSEK